MNLEEDKIKQFNDVFNTYRTRFIRFANSWVKNEFDAEDIVMEAFMNLWEKLNTTEISNMQAYMLSIVKNKIINYLEHQQVMINAHEKIREHEARELNFRITTLCACDPENIFSEEIKTIINNTLQLLSEQDIKIFNLSRFKNKSNKEIAEITGLSVKTVEAHITKTLKLLRKNLKDYMSVIIFFMPF
jgi:RNA polymerase sigma-70 factor (ECF subfamily)